jgi:hypothetical protein
MLRLFIDQDFDHDICEMTVGAAIAELQLLLECSDQGEWNGLVVFLPL